MKNMLLGIGIGVAGTVLFGLGWLSHGWVGKTPAAGQYSGDAYAAGSTSGNPAAHTPPGQRPSLISQGDWQHLRSAREAVLQSNPDLAAEYKSIISDLQTQQNQLDDAMIKADPKVAPIVAKLVALRQANAAHVSSPVPGPR